MDDVDVDAHALPVLVLLLPLLFFRRLFNCLGLCLGLDDKHWLLLALVLLLEGNSLLLTLNTDIPKPSTSLIPTDIGFRFDLLYGDREFDRLLAFALAPRRPPPPFASFSFVGQHIP